MENRAEEQMVSSTYFVGYLERFLNEMEGIVGGFWHEDYELGWFEPGTIEMLKRYAINAFSCVGKQGEGGRGGKGWRDIVGGLRSRRIYSVARDARARQLANVVLSMRKEECLIGTPSLVALSWESKSAPEIEGTRSRVARNCLDINPGY